MGNHRKINILTFLASLLIIPAAVLAATSPTVTRLEFRDTMNTTNPSDDVINRITTGFEANRVSVDGRGNIYISDPIANTISIYNTNGLLVRQLTVNRALAVGVLGSGGLVYVSGSLNGVNSVFVIDNNNNGKNENGNLGIDWARPLDIEVDSSGNVYVADNAKHLIRRFDAEGRIRDFGPYGGERYVSETLDGSVFQRTRHRMVFPQGVAVDDVKGLLYVSIKEFVEYLSNSPGDNSYEDTEESWRYYNYDLNLATDSSYKYWRPVTLASGAKYHILVIDISAGGINKKIPVGDGGDFALKPRGLALDGKGRLYVAAMGGMTAAGGEIKVYDTETGAMLGTTGGIDPGIYIDVAFSPDPTPDPDPVKTKGRLFATLAGSGTVAAYSIDGGTNRINSPPSSPVILFPMSGIYVASLSPVLSVQNATDPDGDPLTYGYEITEGGAVLTSLSGFEQGSGKTDMNVSYPLKENSLYRWKAQAFDGAESSWSNEAEFCVNEKNDNPGMPSVISPKDRALASPFSTYLSWNPSADPDCYDTVKYSLEISDDENFATPLIKEVGIGGTSIKLMDIKGFEAFKNGVAYFWRVMAVDGRGGESGYSQGSFVYRTTSLAFESAPPGSRVYIDGNYGYLGRLLGATPLTVQNIIPGSHFITFAKVGYENYYAIANLEDPLNENGKSSIAVNVPLMTSSKINPSTLFDILKVEEGGASPFVVDYNNDGLKDILVGSGDGRVLLFTSEEQVQEDGSSKVALVSIGALKAGDNEIDVGSRAVPFVVDYDNDGRKDLLTGSADGYVNLYLNKGDEMDPLFVSSGKLNDGSGEIKFANSAPFVVDYNNDGKKDLVLGGGDGSLRLYINIGSDAAPVFDAQTLIIADDAVLTVGSNSKPFFTDWDSDGKKDLVVGRGIADTDGNTANLFLNTGTDDSPVLLSVAKWIKEKRKERGNRDWLPYIPYVGDSGYLALGGPDASIFVVDWSGTQARDIIVGNGDGDVKAHVTGD